MAASDPLPPGDPDATRDGPPAAPDASILESRGPRPAHPPALRVAGYEVLRELSRGGQGIVYQAIQTSTNRKVAIKVLLEGAYGSSAARRRFDREIELVSHLRHPAIIAVFDSGVTDDGRPYYVMDYVRGAPITLYVQQAGLTLDASLALFASVCDAVNHAHQKGVIHRDLKPSHILVDADGSLHILDFGLAKSLSDHQETHATLTGQVMGTLHYMSPEQTRGNPDAIDTRSDVYSLGVVLYEMLTGRHPHPHASSVVEAFKQLTESPPTPPSRAWAPDTGIGARSPGSARAARCPIGDEVETIILKALAKERERRYQSPGELARDIRHYLAREPIEAKRDSFIYMLGKTLRRYRAAALSACGFILILIAFSIAMMIARQRAVDAERIAEDRLHNEQQARQQEQIWRQREQASRRQMQLTLADAHAATALLADEKGEVHSAILWFSAAAKLAEDDAPRSWLNRLRIETWSAYAPIPLRAVAAGPGIDRVQFHPSGKYLLTRGPENRWRAWDINAERQLAWPADAAGDRFAWDASGGLLAASPAQGNVLIYEFPGGNLLQTIALSHQAKSLRFSNDGRWLAIAGAETRVWDCRKQDFAGPAMMHPGSVWAIAFNLRGDKLATACEDGQARIFSINAATPMFEPVPCISRLTPRVAPAFIDDDRALLTRSASDAISRWDANTGQLVGQTSSTFGPIRALAVSPDSHRFAIAGFKLAAVFDSSTATRLSQMTHDDDVIPLAYSADGRELLAAAWERTYRLLATQNQMLLCQPMRHPRCVTACAFSADGRLFATAQEAGLVRVWSRGDGPPRDRRIDVPPQPYRLRISRDGALFLPTGTAYRYHRMTATRLYRIADGAAAGPPLAGPGLINDADISPDGHCVAIAGVEPRLCLYEPVTGARIADDIALASPASSIAFSPDGKQLAAQCRDGQIAMFNLQTRQQIREILCFTEPLQINNAPANGNVGFSPDGNKLLAWAADRTLHVWDAQTGWPSYPAIEQGSACQHVSFSCDGQTMITSWADGSARVYALSDGKPAATVLNHPEAVSSARFSPDRKLIATACRDGSARLWTWPAGTLRAVLPHTRDVYDAVFLAAGRSVMSVSADSTVRLWDASSGAPLTPAIRPAPSAMSIAVSPQRGAALVCGYDQIRVFHFDDLQPDDHWNIDDLTLRCELMSGQRIDQGAAVSLTEEEWTARWQQLRVRHPDWPDASGNSSP